MAQGSVERDQNSFLKTTRQGEGKRKGKSHLGLLPSIKERNERQQVGQASEGDKNLKTN